MIPILIFNLHFHGNFNLHFLTNLNLHCTLISVYSLGHEKLKVQSFITQFEFTLNFNLHSPYSNFNLHLFTISIYILQFQFTFITQFQFTFFNSNFNLHLSYNFNLHWISIYILGTVKCKLKSHHWSNVNYIKCKLKYQ